MSGTKSMYNFSLVCRDSAIGNQIVSTVGVVEEVEVKDGDTAWGEYLRVRIVRHRFIKTFGQGTEDQYPNDCNLLDLGFIGPKYTWCNGRMATGITRERLDRVVANHEWCQNFNVVSVEVLPRLCSDHNPLLVSFSNHQEALWQHRRHFWYEASWEKHKEYGALIKRVWRVCESSESAWTKVRKNLKGCQRVLQRWVRKIGGSLEDQIKLKEKEIQDLQMLDQGFEIEKESQLKAEFHCLFTQEEVKWNCGSNVQKKIG